MVVVLSNECGIIYGGVGYRRGILGHPGGGGGLSVIVLVTIELNASVSKIGK